MAARQYLIPGGAYVNEDTSLREFLIPGSSYLNETSTAPAPPSGGQYIHGHGSMAARLASTIHGGWTNPRPAGVR